MSKTKTTERRPPYHCMASVQSSQRVSVGTQRRLHTEHVPILFVGKVACRSCSVARHASAKKACMLNLSLYQPSSVAFFMFHLVNRALVFAVQACVWDGGRFALNKRLESFAEFSSWPIS